MVTNFDTYLLTEKAQYINFEMLYEKATTKPYQFKALTKKVLNDYKINVYFASTFGTAIPFLIPVIQKLIYNGVVDVDLNAYNISLLTIFSIAEILHINNDGIKKMRKTIQDEGIIELAKNVKNSLLSIYEITVKVAATAGKTIEKFVEMFGYVTIGIPIWQTIAELTSQEGFSIDTWASKVLGLAVGVGAFYLKNLIGQVVDLLSNKSLEK
jgi:hypothetical protein